MERLDLGDCTLPIRIFGQDIDLQKPSVAKIFEHEENMAQAGSDHKKVFQLMRSFLIDMGMPEDVADKMSLDQFAGLMDHLKSLKKN